MADHDDDRDAIRAQFQEAVNMTASELEKVHGHVARHLAQEPEHEDVETSTWRYSLMDRGHDPVKR